MREVMVEAPRGVIYDRNGKILVENRAGLSVGLLPMDMYDPKKEPAEFQQEISGLAGLLEVSRGRPAGGLRQGQEGPVRDLRGQGGRAREHRGGLHQGAQPGIPGRPGGERPTCASIPSGRSPPICWATWARSRRTTSTTRSSPTLQAGAHVGKDGVERKYDSFLRGTDGWKTVEVDAAGRPKRFLEDVAADAGQQPGAHHRQRPAGGGRGRARRGDPARRTSDGFHRMRPAGRSWPWTRAPGEILAMASYPDYDPSLWVGGMSATKYAELNAPQAHYPLFDRAIDGLYPAGSTFKPFVAAAALNAGLITADTIFDCAGKFTVAGQTWKDWKTDGPRRT